MKPSATAYLFGNIVSLLAIVLFTLYAGYGALTGASSGWLALIMLCLCGYATKANRQVTAFADWKREWNAMNGQPQRPKGAALRWLRYPLGIGAWLVGLAYTPSLAGDTGTAWIVWLYWLGSALMVGYGINRVLKRYARTAHRKAKTQAVTVCLNVPLRSVPVNATYNALPDYCVRLWGE